MLMEKQQQHDIKSKFREKHVLDKKKPEYI